MSNDSNCCICATDEGILLEIFGDNGLKAITAKIETCLSVKIVEESSDAVSPKICHKCAFEVDACSKFIRKYRESRDGTDGRANPIKGHCCLCSEPGRKGYIFDCKDGNPLNSSLEKIHEFFDDSIFKDKRRNLSICLNCRYNLDVLFDLKCIYQSTPGNLKSLREKGIQLSELPKTRTRVVTRNTTYIPLPSLNGAAHSDTDSSSTTAAMPQKRKRGRPRKSVGGLTPSLFRMCEECEASVDSGLDMYKFHRSGQTVCKDCWLSVDPEKVTLSKRKKLGLSSGDIGTRRCAIILKDVLSNPVKYERIYKVEKDALGNTTFIITDDSSGSEEREKTPAKRTRRSLGSVTSVESSGAIVRSTPRALKRAAASGKSTDQEEEPPAKGRKVVKVEEEIDESSSSASLKSRNGLAISDTEVFAPRTRRGALIGQSLDAEKGATRASSDAELAKPAARKRGGIRPKIEKPEQVDSSTSLQKTAATTRARRGGKVAAPIVSTSEPTTERSVRRTRANSLSIQDAASTRNRSVAARNAKSVSDSPANKRTRSKTKSLSPKNSGSELELEIPYTCGVCRVEYKNKLFGMEHELSHAKQPEVKLQRVAIPEIVVEEPPAETTFVEEPEEQSHDVSSTSDHRTEDPERIENAPNAPADEDALIDDRADDNVDKELLEKRKKSTEAGEPEEAQAGDEAKEEKEKTVEKSKKDEEEEEKIESKIDDKMDACEEEDKMADKNGEEDNKMADKNGEEGDKMADKNGEEGDKMADKNGEEGDKMADKDGEENDKMADKNGEEDDKMADKNVEEDNKMTDKDGEEDNKMADKNIEEENKMAAEKVEEEGKMDVSEATETETAAEIEKPDERSAENAEEEKTSEVSAIAESEERNEDGEEAEATEKESEKVEDDSKKAESTLGEEVESAEPPKKSTTEDATRESAETNGEVVEEEAEVAEAKEKDKEASDEAETRTKGEIFEASEENAASTIPEAENGEEKGAEKDEAENKENQEAESATTEESAAVLNTSKQSEESESVANDVLVEVFDLATAEVQKRLEKEKTPRDQSCTTPVSETLENISREICNSADMPSLEPLVDEISNANGQS